MVERQRDTAVVFLHGWLMSPDMWSGTMEALGDQVRSVALWQPAHGPSSAPPYQFTMNQWADWLKDTLSSLGITRAVLVGHSMGGLLAQATLRRHPGLVTGMVLVGIQDTAWPRERNEAFGARADAIADDWNSERAAELAPRLLGTRLLERDPGILASWTSEVRRYDLGGFPNLAHAITSRDDFSQSAPSATVPTLVVHGTADLAIAPADGRAMAKRIPGATFVPIADAGHCVPLDEPERFASRLKQFLRKHGLSG